MFPGNLECPLVTSVILKTLCAWWSPAVVALDLGHPDHHDQDHRQNLRHPDHNDQDYQHNLRHPDHHDQDYQHNLKNPDHHDQDYQHNLKTLAIMTKIINII